MSSSLTPLVLYGHWAAPNPFKVAIVLKELELSYEYRLVDFSEVKQEAYVKINPNGRLPALVDPNTNITIWESGAIILYLIDQYDKQGKLSSGVTGERYAALQWLMFQVSGQGPYFGQATWFARFHPEKLPSAIDRYMNEIVRVIHVLDKALAGKQWLVGNKCTYADLSFVTWAHVAKGLLMQLDKAEVLQQASNYSRWIAEMEERDSVKEVVELIAKERAAHGLPP